MRRATIAWIKVSIDNADFYPRSPCGERPVIVDNSRLPVNISIHALLAESDFFLFYPQYRHLAFLSTLSLRRATQWEGMKSLSEVISIHALLAESDLAGPSGPAFLYNFYPRSPCGERLPQHNASCNYRSISIHALLAESDHRFRSWLIPCNDFYPRSPCGERRVTVLGIQHKVGISIHALLAESDETFVILPKQLDNFYPRSPCGERLILTALLIQPTRFLSTLSLRRATWGAAPPSPPKAFLSTLSLRRATRQGQTGFAGYRNFYPRSPCGERLVSGDVLSSCFVNFYPRSPCGERLCAFWTALSPPYFYPRSPCGERQDTPSISMPKPGISIHALLAESDLPAR